MAIGMTLTGLSFLVLWYGATLGENQTRTAEQLSTGAFRVNERVVTNLKAKGVAPDVLDKIVAAKDADGKNVIDGVKFAGLSDEEIQKKSEANVKDGKPALTDAEKTRMKSGGAQLIHAIDSVVPGAGTQNRDAILQGAYLFRVSAFWLIFAYAIVTLGELMLSPMGLSLVSKVAPISKRGLLMGGWFVATAIGAFAAALVELVRPDGRIYCGDLGQHGRLIVESDSYLGSHVLRRLPRFFAGLDEIEADR